MSCGYKIEINSAYKSYYKELHAMQDSNQNSEDYELRLWDKWELVFIEIYNRHHK